MDTFLNLPVLANPHAKKYGFATKLIPILIDGVQTAWEQAHVNSKLLEVRRDSQDALRSNGHRIPFVDYDPIQRDNVRHAMRCAVRPVWTGD